MKAVPLTTERLREVLDYDPVTGIFRWRANRFRTRIGEVAGYDAHGYLKIRIDRRNYLLHRLAWLYVHGCWPVGQIDHRDLNPANNAISNLRDATHAQNKQNSRGLRGDGLKGVRLSHGKWQASIRVNGRRLHLGTFSAPESARAAYVAAASKHHGEFARVS